MLNILFIEGACQRAADCGFVKLPAEHRGLDCKPGAHEKFARRYSFATPDLLMLLDAFHERADYIRE